MSSAMIGAAPSTFAGPTEPGNYDATFKGMDAPVEKTWDDGTASLNAVCHWDLDEFPGEDIWTRVNVNSRGPRSAFDKLAMALTGQHVGYGAVDTGPWLDKKCQIVYGFGNNPKDPNAFGVTGYSPIRQKRAPVAAPAPQPRLAAVADLPADDDTMPF